MITAHRTQQLTTAVRLCSGWTVDGDGQYPTFDGGYIVSLPGGKVWTDTEFCSAALALFFEAHPLQPGQYYGAWIDDDGLIYLDVSVWVADKETALTLGAEWHQQTVYDVATGDCLPVSQPLPVAA